MSLLEGGIRDLFGEIFGEIYPAGLLHKTIRTDDGKGGWTTVSIAHDIKGHIDVADQAMREAPGFSQTDVKVIILQSGVPVTLTDDDEVTIQGQRYKLAGVQQDPARSNWYARGILVKRSPQSSGSTG